MHIQGLFFSQFCFLSSIAYIHFLVDHAYFHFLAEMIMKCCWLLMIIITIMPVHLSIRLIVFRSQQYRYGCGCGCVCLSGLSVNYMNCSTGRGVCVWFFPFLWTCTGFLYLQIYLLFHAVLFSVSDWYQWRGLCNLSWNSNYWRNHSASPMLTQISQRCRNYLLTLNIKFFL